MTPDRRYAPDLRISLLLPTLEKEIPLTSVEIKQGDRALGSAVFLVHPSFTENDPWTRYLRTGLPIQIVWRALGQQGVFTGYLYLGESEDTQQLQLTAIGVGYQFLQKHGHAMVAGSLSNIVREVCSSHQLGFSVSRRGDTRLNTVQGNKTDWEWLKETTLMSGWSCHFRGTTLVAHDLDKIRDFNPLAPVDIILPTKGIFQQIPESAFQVRSFITRRSNAAAGLVKGDPQYTVMTMQGKIAHVGGHNTDTQFTTAAVMSPEDALRNKTQHQYDTRWSDRATLIMDSNSAIYPLDIIRTWTQGRDLISAWSVLSTTLKLGNHDAVIECELGKEESAVLYDRPARNRNNSNARAISYLGDEFWYSEPTLKISPYSKDQGKYFWSPKVVQL